MTFLFDANMPKVLASVLRDLGKSVSHTAEITELGRRALDPSLIAYAADHRQFVVSRDLAMADEDWFVADVKRLGAGVFFLRAGPAGKEPKLWQLAQFVFRAWDEMERFAANNRAPFVALVKQNGTVVTYH